LELASKDRPVRLGIILSGRGSNFKAIARSISEGRLPGVEIAVVVSNVADAAGLEAARVLGLPTGVFISKGRTRAEHDADLMQCLQTHHVNLVAEEHIAYTEAIARVASGEYEIRGRRYVRLLS
jgi:phosphoribosylglycinamide formyltransferase-1